MGEIQKFYAYAIAVVRKFTLGRPTKHLILGLTRLMVWNAQLQSESTLYWSTYFAGDEINSTQAQKPWLWCRPRFRHDRPNRSARLTEGDQTEGITPVEIRPVDLSEWPQRPEWQIKFPVYPSRI